MDWKTESFFHDKVHEPVLFLSHPKRLLLRALVIVPTRGMIHHRVVTAWQNLIAPMNQKRAFLFVSGDEVGKAYDRMIQHALDHEQLRGFKYVLTLEDDNLPPPDAHVRLLESIELGPFDAVSGLYWTKG